MNRCQCLTQKGTQCKLTARPGERFCWIHTNCERPVSSPERSSVTSIIQVPVLPSSTPRSSTSEGRSRLPIMRPSAIELKKSHESKSNDKVDLGLIRMPTPLIERVTEEITERVQSGETAEEATAKTLDEIVEELGYEDITDLIDLTEDEIDYFISTILLHENQEKLADIVQEKIDEQNIRDPHAKLVIKTRELLQELAAKFCRCIKKVFESNQEAIRKNPNNPPTKLTESIAIAICRRGVINSRGLTFPRFSCKTYPNPTDKSRYLDTPIFLPSKEYKKLLRRHPGYQLYLSSVVDGDLTKWSKLGKAEQDRYLKAVAK